MFTRSKRLFQALQWMLLHVTVIECLNAKIAASNTTLTVGKSVTLTCNYNGSGTETTVLWYKGTFAGGVSLALKPNATNPGTCYVFTFNPLFDTTRVSHSCFSSTKTYTLHIGKVTMADNGTWSCTFQDTFVDTTAAEITLIILDETNTTSPTGNNEEVTVGAVCVAHGIVLVIVGVYLIVVYQLYKCNGLRKEAVVVIACEVVGVVQIALGGYLIYSKSQGLTGVAVAGIILAVIGFLILAVGVYFIFQYHWSKCNGNEVKNEDTHTVGSKSKTDGKRHGENRGKPAKDTGRNQLPPPATHLGTQNNFELETQHTNFDPNQRRPLPLGPLPPLTPKNGQQK